MTPLIPALAGALLVAGLIGIVAGLRRTPEPPPRPAASTGWAAWMAALGHRADPDSDLGRVRRSVCWWRC